MAKRRVASAARQAALQRTAERGAARRKARRDSQLERERQNRELRSAGQPTPWERAKALRASARGHA